jgi:hypothetical protein
MARAAPAASNLMDIRDSSHRRGREGAPTLRPATRQGKGAVLPART